jgi:hypothetical protein
LITAFKDTSLQARKPQPHFDHCKSLDTSVMSCFVHHCSELSLPKNTNHRLCWQSAASRTVHQIACVVGC